MSHKVNIIIIGAKEAVNEETDYYFDWNNPLQAPFDALSVLKYEIEGYGYEVSITCVDCLYPVSRKDQCFMIEKGNFDIREPHRYLQDGAQNIVIEFTNMLNETWCSGIGKENMAFMRQYKEYNFALLACGCCWDKGFPSEAIKRIVERGYKTPTDPWDDAGFLQSKSYVDDFKRDECMEEMQPFLQGIFQVMGSLMCRGMDGRYEVEEPLREALLKMNEDSRSFGEMAYDINRFIVGDVRWNKIPRNTRVEMTRVIFGNVEIF